ncbi:Hypothetical protein SCF082_LOCUS14923 [Durusdinium trenchii]|uniref:Uncharacterized protein n=1 Tax=Durusdinium trenchii TaxID=1381693 RepID=A0ABP0K114_9DINO
MPARQPAEVDSQKLFEFQAADFCHFISQHSQTGRWLFRDEEGNFCGISKSTDVYDAAQEFLRVSKVSLKVLLADATIRKDNRELVQILDLKSGQAIIKDRNSFIKRYTCVFRESGSKLLGSCNKRFYFDAQGPTYCLDYETHEHLVTAMPGTPPDGKLGVREPRTEHLMVLYEEKGGKITRMWIKPDADKLGSDPYAGEDPATSYPAYDEM